MNEVIALALKDLRLLLRDKAGFFFTFFFPLIYATFFGVIMSSMGGPQDNALDVVVVNQDGTDSAREFVADLKGSSALKIDEVPDREAAIDLVRRGRRLAYVIIPPGFGEARQRMFWGDPPKLEVGIDPVRRAEAGMLQGLLTRYMFQGLQDAFSNPQVMQSSVDDALAEINAANDDDMDPATRTALKFFLPALKSFMAQMPTGQGAAASTGFQEPKIQVKDVVRARSGPTNLYEISYPQGIIWGIMSCSAAFGISLVTERNKGTLVRLRMAPISRQQVLSGKALSCFLTAFGLAAVLFLVAMIVFDVRTSSPLLLLMAVLSVCICFVGLMMFLAVLGKTEQAAGGAGWAILLVMAMLGGGMIPLAFMPKSMQTLSHVSPVKWSIFAMEGALWRGFSLSEMLMPCAILVAIGAACFLIGARVFRWTD